jgi:hypothetical protein
MDFNQIDLTPLYPKYGLIWQGGSVDAAINALPGPLAIVCMDRGELNEQWVDHHDHIVALLYIGIDDSPDAALSTAELVATADCCIAYLRRGVNLYVHCAAGVSRASYLDIAIHMRILKIGFDSAYQLIKAQRPVISPNSGFVHSLQLSEAMLIMADTQ